MINDVKPYVKLNFNELDAEMRSYEVHACETIPNEKYIIVRLDGRGFSKLTKNMFEKPFDDKFRDLMASAVKHLMSDSGFKIKYGYTQSDEISLLFDTSDVSFGRRYYKIITTLAGDCSAYFSLQMRKVLNEDVIGSFDCKLYAFDTLDEVFTYFIWRQRDASRNSLNICTYWTLINDGVKVGATARQIEQLSYNGKIDTLREHNVDFDQLDSWKKYGMGFHFEQVDKEGFNPIKNEVVISKRNVIMENKVLPIDFDYIDYIKNIVNN